jgi:hypothetical protein
MHPQLAADDDPGIGLAHQFERNTVARVRAHSLADDRGAAAKGEKSAGAGDQFAIRHRLGNLLFGDVVRLHCGQHAERDQIAVGRGVGDVAGAQKRRFREGSAHADQILDAFRQHIAPRDPLSTGIRRGQQHLLPSRIEMAVVPGGVFLDHRPCGGVGGHIVGPALTHDPDPAPIAQGLAIAGAGSHRALRAWLKMKYVFTTALVTYVSGGPNAAARLFWIPLRGNDNGVVAP